MSKVLIGSGERMTPFGTAPWSANKVVTTYNVKHVGYSVAPNSNPNAKSRQDEMPETGSKTVRQTKPIPNSCIYIQIYLSLQNSQPIKAATACNGRELQS